MDQTVQRWKIVKTRRLMFKGRRITRKATIWPTKKGRVKNSILKMCRDSKQAYTALYEIGSREIIREIGTR